MPSQRWQLTLPLRLVLAVVATAAPALGAEKAAATTTVSGRVQFVTDKRAYLDRGAQAGLARGLAVALSRDGRPAGGCTIETVAAHGATCVGGRPRPGDLFRATGAPRPRPAAAVRALPPLIDEPTLQAGARALAEAEVEKVDFAGAGSGGASRAVAIAPGYAAWIGGADPEAQFRALGVDGAVRIGLGRTGLRLEAAFSAVRWQRRPPGAGRFRPGEASQFYLWQAEISRREAGAATVAAVGRLWPWHAPGLTVLDGFQVGRRDLAGTYEAGVYGGLLPDAETLAPRREAWAGGAYASLNQAGSKDALLRLAREEARVGVRRSPAAGLIGEAEALAQLWLGAVDLGASGRVRMALEGDRRPVLELAVVQARLRPTASSGVAAQVCAVGPAVEDLAPLREVAPRLDGSARAGVTAYFDPVPWLGLGLTGGVSRDGGGDLTRGDGAVEVRLPRLFGAVGGLSAGVEAARGWLPGGGAYIQGLAGLPPRIRLLARASATSLGPGGAQNAAADVRELGGSLLLDAEVARWLRLGARALLRVPLWPAGEERPDRPGGVVGVDLSGGF